MDTVTSELSNTVKKINIMHGSGVMYNITELDFTSITMLRGNT